MNASLASPALPQRIGPFPILARLACGGMAEVFLANRACIGGFQRRVVVKRMLPHLAHDPSLAHALLDEGRMMARLRHPNVVAVEELGSDDESLYLVMELLRGASLSSIVRGVRARRQRLHPVLAMHVVAEMCAGLHAAHELRDETGRWLGLVHRDVSPHNVMLTVEGEVKLIDFGIAFSNDAREKTRTGFAKGKFAYMAPEQFSGARPDRRTDVYAAGVVLHELLTGGRLFQCRTDVETVRAVLHDAVPRPSDRVPRLGVPREVEDICMRAIDRDPAARFATAAELRAALRAQIVASRELDDAREQIAELAVAHGDPGLIGAQPATTQPKETATLPSVPWWIGGAVSGVQLRVADEEDEPSSQPISLEVRVDDVARPPTGASQVIPVRPTLDARWLWACTVSGAAMLALLVVMHRSTLPASDTAEPSIDEAATAPLPLVASAPQPSDRVRIAIDSVPPDAEVRTSDRTLGRTPLTLEITRGEAAIPITITAAGHVTVTKPLVPDADHDVRIELERETGATARRARDALRGPSSSVASAAAHVEPPGLVP
ncbi:serine/threonine-protein kinase [Sandaracinus amylolyticus]|uniref:serine/threonine-protein kinase n=1 Tax=Sandaracinus amylolyticus TaxID=927083 RepID=UPI001EFFB6C1|nr:serine/threonine-protein kinase [Sandaracinus amylolyticus]UJR81525.1 Serine/threonine protein kinase PrkC, regulator of stationary phase [Sandaracinus amylolyticus]